MEYDQFKRHLHKAGLSLQDFARLIEVQPASVSNHKRAGFVPKHYAVAAVLLGHLGDEHVDFRALLRKHGVVFEIPKPARGSPTQLKLISSKVR
jgi:hypothetical protein